MPDELRIGIASAPMRTLGNTEGLLTVAVSSTLGLLNVAVSNTEVHSINLGDMGRRFQSSFNRFCLRLWSP